MSMCRGSVRDRREANLRTVPIIRAARTPGGSVGAWAGRGAIEIRLGITEIRGGSVGMRNPGDVPIRGGSEEHAGKPEIVEGLAEFMLEDFASSDPTRAGA